jgi:hypothetical protein
VAAACREAPARDVRRIGGTAAEVRAVGLPLPEAALDRAFEALGRPPAGTASSGGRGQAVDRAVAVLRAAGARKALVNFGGVHLAVFGESLTVAAREPGSAAAEAPPWATFELNEAALATANAGGNPEPWRSATVVAASADEAELLAGAAVALAADQGLALLAERKAAGFFLLREGDRKVIRATPGFASAHRLEPSAGVEVRP